MARRTYVWDPDTRKLVPKEHAKFLKTVRGGGPNVIGDIGEVRSMVDGKVYTSRRHLKDHYRAAGVVEVGNDFNNQPLENRRPEPTGVREDVARAISERS